MKKYFFISILILFVPLFVYSQSSKIEGTWYNDEKSSTIDIKKGSDSKYNGAISWLETPNENGKPKLDTENPDARLAKKPLLGLVIVKNFKYDSGKKQYTDGKIYDPNNGKTYDCYAWFEDGNYKELYIKGYVAGIKALGRKTMWTRK